MESECQWDEVDEGVDLESADEEKMKVFEHFSKEIPKKSNVWF